MAKRLRNLFTDEQVKYAIAKSQRDNGTTNYVRMSHQLSNNPHGSYVSPELCRYWAKQFDHQTKAGNDYKTLAKANSEIKSSRELRTPSPLDDKPTSTPVPSDNFCILVIPDLHAPYHHPDSLDFLSAVADAFSPDTVVNLGDETDKHAMSFHDSDPNLDSAGMELQKSRDFLAGLHNLFPEMKLCHSNHGSMAFRKAKSHGIPVEYLRTYREVLFPNGGGEGWDWAYEHILDLPDGSKAMFKHQPSGDPTANAAHEGVNLITGHLHAKFCINYAANSERLYWSLQSGCLVDNKSLAFAYGKDFKFKPVIGCSVILDSIPFLVPMRMNEDGRWIGSL